MSNGLITGGTGFIGWWLSQKYLADKMPTTMHMNFTTYDDGFWQECDWDFIIHLAPVPVDRVIECAKRCNATVLLASSGGVYDREPDPYFKMKLDDENKLLASGLDVKIARIFTTCGAHMKWSRYAIGNFIMQAEKGGPIEVQSHGLVVRSYMYGSDLAEWLWAILLHGEPGGVYNVGSDVPHSTAELAFEIARQFPTPWIPKDKALRRQEMRKITEKYPLYPSVNIIRTMQFEPRPFYVPDISRAREELGLTIKVPFEEAVRHTVEDYRNEK
jgi:nucleoside-diphosphate-sugar epimerase